MSKKKTRPKVIPLQSPANYIRAKARSLPVDKCYAIEDWEEAGMSLVIVSRRHVNGNFPWSGSILLRRVSAFLCSLVRLVYGEEHVVGSYCLRKSDSRSRRGIRLC